MTKLILYSLAAVGAIFSFMWKHEAIAGDLTPAYAVPDKTTEVIEESKLSSRLKSILIRIEDMGVTRSNVQDLKSEELSTPLVKFDNSGNVQTYIHIEQIDQEKLARLEALGAVIEITNAEHKIAQAWVPFDKLEEIAHLEFVKQVTPPDYGLIRTGSITTEGDAILGSDDVRDILGFDGTGVLVGVISDGVVGLALSQAAGDLPDDIIIGSAGNGSEGRALLEIIHDIAPGAELAFSSGLTSMSFIDSIEFLKNAGADVIVDDLGFLGEPFFADGPIAREAVEAVDDGVVFVSSAGNDADQHYQGLYTDTDQADDDNNLHDFGFAAGEASDTAMRVSIPPQQTVIFVLQWDDRFGQSSNDYDLFLFDPATSDIIDSGTSLQNGNDNPVESAGIINDSSSFEQVDIVINRFGGEDRTLEIFFNGPVIPQEFNVPGDSIWGHPAVPGVIAVGAVPASNPNSIEDYSSRGPVTITFPPETRPKPDVVAPDGISTSVDGFDPFFGTSASAPHVAGVAALMLDKNPNLTLAQVAETLVGSDAELSERQDDIPMDVLNVMGDTAEDLGQPGFDNTYGFGRVDAFEAVEFIAEGSDGDQDGDDGEEEGNNGGSSCSLAAGSGTANVISLYNLAIILIPLLLIVLRRVS